MSEHELPPDAARRVRLVLLDVDGVLTDNGVWIGGLRGGGESAEYKRFDVQDGLGVKLLVAAGIAVELLSGRASPATTLRAEELGVHATQIDGGRKLGAAEARLAEHHVSWQEVAVVGDDLADLPLLRRAGLPVAVANAVEEVREQAAWTTTRPGGSGAVREFAHALLEARGQRAAAVAQYERARTDPARDDAGEPASRQAAPSPTTDREPAGSASHAG
ncbi:MAG TPA: HAD hydrolase family protein [Longimicrobiales bacterium]|nr:HAD hydrolase family protein [Longimicrobiales bacterium]